MKDFVLDFNIGSPSKEMSCYLRLRWFNVVNKDDYGYVWHCSMDGSPNNATEYIHGDDDLPLQRNQFPC